MSEEIKCDRRRLLGTAALMFAAGQFGMLGAAPAQSGKIPPAHRPAIGGATGWLNSPPLGPSGLRGNVVLINIWTYTCINWLRQLPYVRAWAEKYKDRGFVVIGVHSPEFAFEKDVENVRRAVADLRVDYPVAIDSDHAIWRAFKNAYWPALYVVDAQGRMRHHHFGEGAYEQSERIMQHLLGEAGIGGIGYELVAVEVRGLEAAADWAACSRRKIMSALHAPKILHRLAVRRCTSAASMPPPRRCGAIIGRLQGIGRSSNRPLCCTRPMGASHTVFTPAICISSWGRQRGALPCDFACSSMESRPALRTDLM